MSGGKTKTVHFQQMRVFTDPHKMLQQSMILYQPENFYNSKHI